MNRKLLFLFALLLLFMLALTSALSSPVQAADKDYWAEKIDTTIEVEEHGSLLVTESIVFRFSSEPFTYVYRELPKERTDGITILSAQIDGQTLERGIEEGQVEIEDGDPIKVTWHFSSRQDTSSTFTLTYRVDGVIQKEAQGDVLHWNALPTKHEYIIDTATITVLSPEDVSLQGQPEITEGNGSIVSTTTGRTVFRTERVEEDDGLQIRLTFSSGSLISAPPAWQQAEQQASQRNLMLVPFFLGGGFFIIAVGSWLLIRYQRRTRPDPVQALFPSGPYYAPPDDLSPALAGTLVQSHPNQCGWHQTLGALFGLANRGVIHMEAPPRNPTQPELTDIHVTRQEGRESELHPHEQTLLTNLFKGKDTISFYDITHHYQSWSATFKRAVNDEMQELGLIDARRQQTHSTLIATGTILFVLAMLALIASFFLIIISKLWVPFILAGSLFVISIVAWLLTSSPVWTDDGLRRARSWRQFAHHLSEAASGRNELLATEDFARYLPYAATFGHMQAWTKCAEKQEQGIMLPRWFSLTANADSSSTNTNMVFLGSMVAMHSATSSHSGSGSISAGSGAAGGGGSGAG